MFDTAGAKAAGYSDEEIQAYLASKQNQPKEKNFMQKTADVVAPAMQKFIKSITGAASLGQQGKATESLNQQLNIRQQSLLQQAQQETDPIKKQELLQMARQTVQEQGNTTIGAQANQIQSEVGMQPGQGNLSFAAKTGLGVGAEVGSWVAPASGLKVGGSKVLGKVGTKVLGTGGTGMVSGGLTALSDNENQDLMSTIKGAITGAVFGKGTELLSKAVSKTWKAITKTTPKAVIAKALGTKTDDEYKAAIKALESGAPTRYKQMEKYAKEIGKDAEINLQGVVLPTGLTPQQLFGTDDFNKIQTAMVEAKDLAEELVTKREYDSATKLNQIITDLNTGKPISLQDGLELKRAFQIGYNEKLTEAGAAKRVARQNISNDLVVGIRKSAEDQGFPIVGALLDREKYSLILGKMAKNAQIPFLKKQLPSLLELSAIMGGTLATTTTGSPIGGVAAGAFMINRALQDPRWAAKLFKAGKVTDVISKKTSGKGTKVVKDFFYRGTRREAAKVGAEL